MYGNSSPKKIERRRFPGKNTFDLDAYIEQVHRNTDFRSCRKKSFLPSSFFRFDEHFKNDPKFMLYACKRITRVVLVNDASLSCTMPLHCDRMCALHCKRKRAGHDITSNPRSRNYKRRCWNMIIRLAGFVWKELLSCREKIETLTRRRPGLSRSTNPQFYLMILINLDLVTNRSRLVTRRKSEFLRRLISFFSEYFWYSKDVLLVRWLQSRENKKSAFRHWVRD